jgi:hypothetical protein
MKSLCRRHFFRLVSLWHFAHFMGGGHTFRPKLRVVSCCSIRNPSRTLEAQLRRAQALTPELISDVTAEACVCFAARGGTAKQRINRLIDAGAWTDTALALLELELPQWKLRRIVYEDGEWHSNCSVAASISPCCCVNCVTLGPRTICQCHAQFIIHAEITDAQPHYSHRNSRNRRRRYHRCLVNVREDCG